MKTKLLMLGLSVFVAVSAHANGSDKGGNGGGAEYCKNPKPGQLKMQSYDLWEGRNPVDPRKKLEIAGYDGVSSKQQYLDQALQKVAQKNEAFAAAIGRAIGVLNAKKVSRENLSVVKDAHDLLNDVGADGEKCVYYQLVNWVDDAESFKFYGVDQEIVLRDDVAYEMMDPLNQAANDFHEGVFKVQRAFHLQDEAGSVFVRRFVAEVFSTTTAEQSLFAKLSKYQNPTQIAERLQVGSSPISDFPGYKVRGGAFYFDHVCKAGEKPEVSVTNVTLKSISAHVEWFDYSDALPKFKSKFWPGQSYDVPVLRSIGDVAEKNALQAYPGATAFYFYVFATGFSFNSTNLKVQVRIKACGEEAVTEFETFSSRVRIILPQDPI